MPAARMVLLTTVASPATARILAAHLGSEGVVWQLRGADGVYPMGPVELLVDEDDLEVAGEVLTTLEVADLAEPEPLGVRGVVAARRRRVRRLRWTAVALALLLVAQALRHLVLVAF